MYDVLKDGKVWNSSLPEQSANAKARALRKTYPNSTITVVSAAHPIERSSNGNSGFGW